MHVPGPIRATIGFYATAVDEARRLPGRAIEFPMLALSAMLQTSLRAQQRYARLAARGDEVLHHRSARDEPPPWATFDEPISLEELLRVTEGQAAATSRPDPGAPQSHADLDAGVEATDAESTRFAATVIEISAPSPDAAALEHTTRDGTDDPRAADAPPTRRKPATRKTEPRKATPPDKSTPPKQSPSGSAAKRAARKPVAKAGAAQATPAKPNAESSAPEKSAPEKSAPEKSAPDLSAPDKPVNAPRHTAPSKFDSIGDA